MKIPIKDIKQSEEILEIRRVNPVFVSRYRQAMREGDEFPPIVVTPENVAVAGNHRLGAYSQEYPETHKIECIVKEFDSKADMIAFAVQDNARHGNPLDGISRKRAILKLIELGKKEDEVASLIGVSVKRITELAGQHVVVRGSGKKPVKRGLEHMAGKTVSKSQYKSHDKRDRAMNIVSQCEQITRWLENGWVDMECEENKTALINLGKKIDKSIGVIA